MANYKEIDLQSSIFHVFDQVLLNIEKSNDNSVFTDTFKEISRKILLFSNKSRSAIKLSANQISQKYHNLKVAPIIDVFNQLQEIGIGTVEKGTPNSFGKVDFFLNYNS